MNSKKYIADNIKYIMEKGKNINNLVSTQVIKKMYLKEIEKARVALLSAKTPREIRALQARIKYFENLLKNLPEE